MVPFVHLVLLKFKSLIFYNFKFGQLGKGNFENKIEITCIPSFTASHSSTGYYHNLIQLKNGAIYGFGHNLVIS
jgi:alpha-tubulin suppressor-like RCC1 family protein